MDTTFDLAIVGFGPRGLYMLEQYFLKHSQKEIEQLPKVLIFEKDEVVKDDGTPYVVYTPYSKKWKEKLKKTIM